MPFEKICKDIKKNAPHNCKNICCADFQNIGIIVLNL